MTQYIKSPDMITIAPDFSGIALDKVPAGYYRVSAAPGIGFHLVPVQPLNVPDKVYGSLLKHAPRINEVFNEREGVPTTVLLEGLKGSGKSLMMKTIAKNFVNNEDGIVLLVDAPFAGSDFFSFLQQIDQKKIVLMDEFDKTYSTTDERNAILTLLDGNYASHTLFVLTMNASSADNKFEFFHNRPGRVFFNIKFKAVDYDAIQAYLEDHLDDKSKVADVLMFTKRFTAFNMDMLGTFVREVNAAPHLDLDAIAEYLNTKPDLSIEDMTFEVVVMRNGVDVSKFIPYNRISDYEVRKWLQAVKDVNRNQYHVNMESSYTYHDLYDTESFKPVDQKKLPADLSQLGNSEIEEASKGKYKYGLLSVSVNGVKTITDCFDEYINLSEFTLEQDTKSGTITLTGKEQNGDEDYVIKILPQVRQRYNLAF